VSSEAVAVFLLLGQISYGEFASKRAKISDDLSKSVADLIQAQQAERNAQRNAAISASTNPAPTPNPYGYHPPQTYFDLQTGRITNCLSMGPYMQACQ